MFKIYILDERDSKENAVFHGLNGKDIENHSFFLMGQKGSWLGFHETNSNSAIVLIICFVSIFDAVIAVFRNQHMHDEYEDLHSEPWYATSYLMIIATIYLFVLLKISYFNLRGQLLLQHVIETDHPPPLSFIWPSLDCKYFVNNCKTITKKKIQCTNAENLYTEIANR